MYVITGATGNTGSRIAHALLDEGRAVRVIGRSADRLQEFADKGAEVFEGELGDSAAMRKAFAGSKAAYVMIPPKMDAPDLRAYQNQVLDAVVPAVRDNGVEYVVTLSSIGADRKKGNGPVGGLYDMEQRFAELDGVQVLHLRPGYFMENTLGFAGMAKAMGMFGSPIPGDIPIPMIATQDISAVAIEHLRALDFSGHSHRELQGQRDVSYNEVAKIYGEKAGRPDLKYVQFPPDQALEGMMQMGIGRSTAESYNELAEGLQNGIVQFREPRSASTSTPTSIEQFADTWAAVYNSTPEQQQA